jgi:AcrR family transcriptional regulator
MTDRAARARADAALPDGSPGSALRRAPFADNPAVGERGQQAQQRILAAALEVFGEVGYHQCRVQRITALAGCSRVSFYQYFSSKEDLFRHLAGRLARRLGELVDALPQITADEAGRDALVRYFEEYSLIYDEYQPIFVAFQTAAASDEAMAEGAHRVGAKVQAHIEAKITDPALQGDELRETVRTIIESAVAANRIHEVLVDGEPAVRLSRRRVNVALADVSHRALFGVLEGINLRTPPRRGRAFPLEDVARRRTAASAGTAATSPGPNVLQTRAAVLEAGHKVYAERGYHGTRVDDIVSAAGVSHGVFYRYFKNKDELFRLLAAQAAQRFAVAYDELGALDLGSADVRERFRAWLDHYADTCAEAAAIMRVWVEGIVRDPQLGSDSSATVRDGCRAILRLLAQRPSGDVEAEAVVMLVLLEAMTARRPSARRTARVGSVIERGLLLV